MSVIILLISVSLFVATGFLIAFLWAVKNGQYEDDYTPSVRILYETQSEPKPETNTTKIPPAENTEQEK